MSDETINTGPGSTPNPGEAAGVVAYCQQCGRPLTASTERRVGSGIYCEPCASVRQAQATGWTRVNAAGASPYAGATGEGATTAEPNPALAGFLGLIPGVGAMYNGQYAKGVIHLVVFVVLVSLADNLNWVFWWFVWGWVFYQAFEAYHTAQARRDGLPLPDAFGWNELADRLGFTRSVPPAGAASRPPPALTCIPGGTPRRLPLLQRRDRPRTRPQRVSPRPQSLLGANPVPTDPAAGPNPYTQTGYGQAAFTQTAYGQAAYSQAPYTSTQQATPYGQVPCTPAYTAGPGPTAAGQPVVGDRRFPVGAMWLIGLGILFLIGNILPTWRIEGRWLVPLLLAVIAFVSGARRLSARHPGATALIPDANPNLAAALFGPCILLTIAALLALQDAYVLPLRHSWPALLIVWGALLLLQRAPLQGRPAEVVSPNPAPESTSATASATDLPSRP